MIYECFQGFPHPLHSAELILQLVRKVNSRPTSSGDSEQPTSSVIIRDVHDPLTRADDSLNSCKVTYHVAIEKSPSVLAAVAEDVRQWALQHAYSSSWIQHFQTSS